MTASEFVDRVSRDHFFGWLETRPHDEVPKLLPWLELLHTGAIEEWLFGSRTGKLACRAETPWTPVLRLLLRRHLLSVPNRTDPAPLWRFWERAVGHAAPAAGTLWEAGAPAGAKDDPITVQEARFTQVLARAARDLVRSGGPGWAEETVRTLLAERPDPDSGTITHVSARVVFGWEPPDHELFRAGVLVDFRLLAAGAGPTLVTAPEVFDGRFHDSLARVRTRIDAELVRQMEHRWAFLPPGFLTQASGTAAVFLSQWLASRSQFEGGRYHALPPWVVVSGTFHFDGPAPGGTLGPAGLLAEKARVLAEEGVRCLVVSAASDVSRLPPSGPLEVLRTTGGVREVAAELHGRQLVLPADLKPLDSHLLVRPTRAELNQPAVRDRARFRHANLAANYVPPTYAFAAVEAARQQLPGRGVIHLVGDGMMGKSVLVKALKERWDGTPDRLGATLGYAVLHGRPEDPWLFLSDVVQQARRLDPDGTLGLSNLPDDPRECKTLPDVHRSLVEVLSAVRESFCRSARPVVLAVDGLDEITAGDETEFACRIDDLLPPAASLPDGCYILLTSRPTVRAQVRAAIDRWREAADLYRPVELTRDDPGYRAVLESFLLKHCGEAVRGHVGQILRLADDRFLYVHFLSSLLDERSLRDTPPGRLELPAGDAVFPAYLGRLAAAVEGGPAAFERWHRPLLLLIAAAYGPVTRHHLRSWLTGRAWDRTDNNQLDLALNELGVLLDEERPADVHDSRYRVAHGQILEWLRAAAHPDWVGALLRDGHGPIAGHGVAVTTRLAADLASRKESDGPRGTRVVMGPGPADALTWVPSHLMDLGEHESAKRVLDDPTLTICTEQLIRALGDGWQTGRALDLYSVRIGQHRRLAENVPHHPATELAVLHGNRADTYRTAGRFAEAARDIEEAMRLVESACDPDGRRLYGTLHAVRAKLSLALDRPEQAWADFDRAIAVLQTVVATTAKATPRTPREVVHLQAYADAFAHRGRARVRLGQAGDAIRDLTEAIDIYRAITRAGCPPTAAAEPLAAAFRHRAVAHGQLGDAANARADYGDAVAAYRLVLCSESAWSDVTRGSPGTVLDYGTMLVEFGAVEVRSDRASRGVPRYRAGVDQIERVLGVHDMDRLARDYSVHLYAAADAYLALPQLRQDLAKAGTESSLETAVEFCKKALALVRLASAATREDASRAAYLRFQCHAKLSELYFESDRQGGAVAEAMNAVPHLRSVVEHPDGLKAIFAGNYPPLVQCLPVWVNLANALSASGLDGQSRQLLDPVLEFFPRCLALLEGDQRSSHPLEALQRYLAGAYNSRGSCYRGENRPDAALADFDRALGVGANRLSALLAEPSPGTVSEEAGEFACVMAAVYGNRCAANRELNRLADAAKDAGRLISVLRVLARVAGAHRAALDRFRHVFIPSAHCLLNLAGAQMNGNEIGAGLQTLEAIAALFRPLVEEYGSTDVVIGHHAELLEAVGMALLEIGGAVFRRGDGRGAVDAWSRAFGWLYPYLERWRTLDVEVERRDRLVAGRDQIRQWIWQRASAGDPILWRFSGDDPFGIRGPVSPPASN